MNFYFFEMGQKKSKVQKKPAGKKGKSIPEIPRESLLGWMIEHWGESPERSMKSKEIMVDYCTEIWGGKEIRENLTWPVFGTSEKWACRALSQYVEQTNPHAKEYAELWQNARTEILPIRTSVNTKTQNGEWEPLDNLPPPYLNPQPQPVQAQAPPVEVATPVSGQAPVPQIYPQLHNLSPSPVEETKRRTVVKVIDSPLSSRTRFQNKKVSEIFNEDGEDKNKLFPLREVPTAPGIIGYVNIPINTGDVRAFKKEMGKLLDDPLGVADRLDEFLGTSIYSYEDISAILQSLFSNDE